MTFSYSLISGGNKHHRRTRSGLIAAGIVATVIVIAAVYWAAAVRHAASPAPETPSGQPPAVLTVSFDNPVQQRAAQQLHDYAQWLQGNNAKGYIGEFGWPAGTDTSDWSGVAQKWLDQLGTTDMWATAWAAGSKWPTDYPLLVYGSSDGTGLNQTGPHSSLLEPFWRSPDRRGMYGINIAGMEFGENISTKNRGTAGQDYFYEPAVSYAYLAQQGVKLVRLPVQWERVQPKLFGPLDDNELAAITTALEAAAANDIQVIIDLHNYGTYNDGKTQLKLGSSGLNASALGNFWNTMTQKVGSHTALAGYSLMNEPHDLWPTVKPAEAAKKWEELTQQVVTAIRGAGYDGTLFVPGYDWSSLARWRDNHPKAWIKDPQNNIRYEAHHYWDTDGSGRYTTSFANEAKL